jgi:hypothetical protein
MQIATRISVALAAGLTLVGLAGCEMRMIPLSAQAGSTVAIALGDASVENTAGYGYGYGGDPSDPSAIIDYQRGQMVFKLSDPVVGGCPATGPCYIPARAASAAVGAESTAAARDGANAGREIVVILDIPPDVEPGTYDLELFRRLLAEDGVSPTIEEPVLTLGSYWGFPIQRQITVLPHQLDPDKEWKACGPEPGLPVCGSAAVTGESTPYEFRALGKAGAGFADGSYAVFKTFPNPELLMDVPLVSTTGVYSLEVEIYYPSDKIEMLEAVAPIRNTNSVPPNARPIVIFDDDPSCTNCPPAPSCTGSGTIPWSPGRVEVTMIVKPGPGVSGNAHRINQLGFVFDLIVNPDGSFSRLDPDADLCTNTVSAADENGDPLALPVVTPIGVI